MLALAASLTACGDGGDDDANEGSLTSLVRATADLRFDPDEVVVRFNRDSVFTFENDDDDREHNITITHVFTDPDNFLSVDVEPGGTTQVRFRVTERPRDGFLSFYCKYHQSQGMSGRIRLT